MVVALTMVDRPIPVALVEMAAAVLLRVGIQLQAQQELQTLAAVLAVVVIMK